MRIKKSRKIGVIGVRKVDTPKKLSTESSKKKGKGNHAGSRQQTKGSAHKNNSTVTKTDPRLGSTKRIDLNRYKQAQSTENNKLPSELKPEDELRAIESDSKLNGLLHKLDSQGLSKAEQHYVNERLSKHKILCESLGYHLSEDTVTSDPLSDFEAITINEFKD